MLPVTKRAIPLGPCRAHAQPKDRWADGVKAVSRRGRWRAAPALGPAGPRARKTQLLLGPDDRLPVGRQDQAGAGVGDFDAVAAGLADIEEEGLLERMLVR